MQQSPIQNTYLREEGLQAELVDPFFGGQDGLALLSRSYYICSLLLGMPDELVQETRIHCVDHIEEVVSVRDLLVQVLIGEVTQQSLIVSDHLKNILDTNLIQLGHRYLLEL